MIIFGAVGNFNDSIDEVPSSSSVVAMSRSTSCNRALVFLHTSLGAILLLRTTDIFGLSAISTGSLMMSSMLGVSSQS